MNEEIYGLSPSGLIGKVSGPSEYGEAMFWSTFEDVL